MKRIAILLAAAAVAACASRDAGPPPRYVVVKQAPELDASGAARSAKRICGKHGVEARLEIADETGAAAHEYVFRCDD